MEFPVWAKAIHSQGTVKATAGSVNIPVVCAGAAIAPGRRRSWPDVDGVVVGPRQVAAEVAKLGEERVSKEEQSRARLKAENWASTYGLRAKLPELGVKYVDEA